MPEIAPQIELTKIEQYQTARSSSELSQQDLLALSWQIATQPSLYRQLIPNPYSKSSLQTLSESFPDVSRQDAIKATILAEPEGAYDRRFKQLPPNEQERASYQLDSSATMTVRLVKYLNKRPQAFWDMPEEIIYPLLTEVAFGTADPEGIEKNYSQIQRRGFRLAIVNFIEDLQKLKPYREEFNTDAKAVASRIFGREFTGEMKTEALPVGFILYLNQADFMKMHPPGQFAEAGSEGGSTINSWSSPNFPKELEGKIIIINQDHQQGEFVKETREHELRHILFDAFMAEVELVEPWYTEEKLGQLTTQQDHYDYAERLRKSFTEYAKNELISYFGSEETEYKSLRQIGGHKWLDHLEKIREHLWMKDDLSPEQKTLIYRQYTGKFIEYLWQVREYQWIERNLFNSTKKGGLSEEKAEALLQNTPFDKAKRLARYFGVEPSAILQKIQQEQEQQVREFSKGVDKFVSVGRKGMSWQERDSLWERLDQITRLTHPKEALPSLAKFVEEVNEANLLPHAIDGIEVILYMHQTTLSSGELNNVRSALNNMITKRTSANFDYVRARAEEIIKTIDEVYLPGGEDFIHNPPLVARVAKLMKVPEGQSPSLDQVTKLIELLKGQNELTWEKYFKIEYIDLLEQLEAIPALIELAETTNYCGLVVKALGIFESSADKLTPETKRQAMATIESVLSKDYHIGTNDLTDLTRRYARQVKDEIEKV